MNVLITGICGFVGSTFARLLVEAATPGSLEITGIDNFSRFGSEINRPILKRLGVRVVHGDIRNSSDVDSLGDIDWVIDAAANPSILAGVDGRTSSRQVVEHNLQGTINLLELCKARQAGFILVSTSRVYSVAALAAIPVKAVDSAYQLDNNLAFPCGVSAQGLDESFPVTSPVSLYGATKLASEQLALEYGASFDFPVWINRCGVLAGAGQFGRSDQGILSYWIMSWLYKRPLTYIGFGGAGLQVRDFLHPRDLLSLLRAQIADGGKSIHKVVNLGGGIDNTISLANLSAWCADRFGPFGVLSVPAPRPFDAPWVVMDSTRAHEQWGWGVETGLHQILEEIAAHAESNPHWLGLVE